jgi:tetrahydromethanopterin S-methyltransferase subunit G
MPEAKESQYVTEGKDAKGFGGGLVVGLVVGTILFLITVQLLHMAR